MFKEAPKILFSNLTKPIGEPRDIDKNLEQEDYFNKDIDITIPQAGENTEMKPVQRNIASELTSAATSMQASKPVA